MSPRKSSNPFKPSSSGLARDGSFTQVTQNFLNVSATSDPIAGYADPDLQEAGPSHQREHPSSATRKITHTFCPTVDDEDDELLLTPQKARREDANAPTEEVVEDMMEQDAPEANDWDDQPTDPVDEEEDVEEDEDEDEDADEDLLTSHDEEEEEDTLLSKPPAERQEIEDEMEDLADCMPELIPQYRLIDRLGTGTFSSVYKAEDLQYHLMDNMPWLGHHPPASSAHSQSKPAEPHKRVYVAVKRIYVTSNPERIRNEISILEDVRGARHVSQLITAFRRRDQVVAVIPYQRYSEFRDFYHILPWEGIRSYFRCLFKGLRDVHARNIIHRDVKPANFLFDPDTNLGMLCDFGLASRIEVTSSFRSAHGCYHTSSTREAPHGKLLDHDEMPRDLIRERLHDARRRSALSSDKIGYPMNDMRPQIKVNRAGTRGFRAPEVLLKCPEQSGAIDVWSAGVMLLFFLCGKHPLFRSNDDTEALMEIAAIIGRKRMQRVAALHARAFITNVPTLTEKGVTWEEFCVKMNPTIYTLGPPASDPDASPSSSTSSLELVDVDIDGRKSQVDGALDLLNHLLDPDCTDRFTPKEALQHPWLSQGESVDDDYHQPHPKGEGVCNEFHTIDETDEHIVMVGETYRRLVAGEGVAIGENACEFHQYRRFSKSRPA